MHYALIKSILLAVACGAVSFWLTSLVRAHALQHAVLDHPNERSSHTVATPRGGGLATVVAIAVAIIAGMFLGLLNARDALALDVGVVMVGAVGWADDKRSVGATIRLTVHAAAALWTLVVLGGFPSLCVGVSSVPLGLLGYALGIVGIVWSINLFNFMDGIDGLAGSQSVLIFGTAAALLYAERNFGLGFVATVVAAATAGFLPWNWPPARIFLGDVGSGAIGYLAAALALASENQHAVPLLAFAIIGAVFIVDATVTLLRRKIRGDHLAEAHRDHAYQRLTRAWGSHRSVTLGAAVLTTSLSIVAAVTTRNRSWLMWGISASYVVLGALFIVIERRTPMSATPTRRR